MFNQIKENIRVSSLYKYTDDIAYKMYEKDNQIMPHNATTEREFFPYYMAHLIFLFSFFGYHLNKTQSELKDETTDLMFLLDKFGTEIQTKEITRSFYIPAAEFIYHKMLITDKSALDKEQKDVEIKIFLKDLSRITETNKKKILNLSSNYKTWGEQGFHLKIMRHRGLALINAFLPNGIDNENHIKTIFFGVEYKNHFFSNLKDYL